MFLWITLKRLESFLYRTKNSIRYNESGKALILPIAFILSPDFTNCLYLNAISFKFLRFTVPLIYYPIHTLLTIFEKKNAVGILKNVKGRINPVLWHHKNAAYGVCSIFHVFLTFDLRLLTHVKFPEDILDLRRNLRTLDVSNNRIDELPDDIGVMQMLRTFKIDDNKLGEPIKSRSYVAQIYAMYSYSPGNEGR